MALGRYVGFRVEPGKWANFEQVAAANGFESQELLREFVAHADSLCQALKAGQIASMDGDVAAWVSREFPRLEPSQLRLFAAILASAAEKVEAVLASRG